MRCRIEAVSNGQTFRAHRPMGENPPSTAEIVAVPTGENPSGRGIGCLVPLSCRCADAAPLGYRTTGPANTTASAKQLCLSRGSLRGSRRNTSPATGEVCPPGAFQGSLLWEAKPGQTGTVEKWPQIVTDLEAHKSAGVGGKIAVIVWGRDRLGAFVRKIR